MNRNFFIQNNPIVSALVATTLLLALVLSSFTLFEPAVVLGQATDSFTVTQSITGEISFRTTAADVTMAPSIAGITGGISSGTTTVAVATNDPDGYTLSIAFADATAMQYDLGAQSIPNFGAGTAQRLFTVAAGDAGFALTASSTSVVDALKDTGAACGSGSPSLDTCWIMNTTATTPLTIVDRSSPTIADGERTDIVFRVGVGANPSPALPVGTYTATATLTATEK